MVHKMKLHEDKDVFQEFITATASHFNIPDVYVEKDYWVTKMLLNLYSSDYKELLVFKGGTALSKAHKLINRFSEDVDLAYVKGDLSDNQLKKKMKAAEACIADGFTVINGHERESKGSRIRKTVYEYPKLMEGEFGQASQELLLEINTFADPEPFTIMVLQTLIADYLIELGKLEFVDQFNLSSFELPILNIERTLCEKIMGLIKASRSEDYIQELKTKIRHIYDICMILRLDEYNSYIESDEFLTLLNIVKETDLKQAGSGLWLDQPFNDVALFKNEKSVWGQLTSEFNGTFADMVYDDDLPNDTEVTAMLSLVQKNLERFEENLADTE